MKYYINNLAYGKGSVGDEAILAGLLTKFNLKDVVVGSYSPQETFNLYQVETVIDESDFKDFDVLIIGGGAILTSTAVSGLNRLVKHAKENGKRVEFRAVDCPILNLNDFSGNIQQIIDLLKQADYVTFRSKLRCEMFSKHLSVDFETDWAFYCPKIECFNPCESFIGFNSIYESSGLFLSENIPRPIPIDDYVVGIAGCRHYIAQSEDDFKSMDGLKYLFFEIDPRKMRYILGGLKALYTQRKHLGLLAHLEGVSTFFWSPLKTSQQLMEEWGICRI